MKTDLLKQTLQVMTAYVEKHAPSSFLLAYSGGLDSTVLLHLFSRLRGQFPGVSLKAVHVHHGLQAVADGWVVHCQQYCKELNIPLRLHFVDATAQAGESREAAARRARYGVMAEDLPSGAFLLLGQHRDDQAETVLLQLFRGAGLRGLSGISPCKPFAQGYRLRPLLDVPRHTLETYAREHGLSWVEDPSNSDAAFDRNFLRNEILPRLRQRWPGLDSTLARSATVYGEEDVLLAELVSQQLTQMVDDQGRLDIQHLNRCTPALQRRLLRGWIEVRGFSLPSRAQLQRLLDEVVSARVDAQPEVSWEGAQVRRFRQWLYLLEPRSLSFVVDCPWDVSYPFSLPNGARLVAETTEGEGLRDEWRGGLRVAYRQGGEEIRVKGDQHTRPLQKLFQQAGVPPWERDEIPLLFQGEELVAVVGYWLADAYAAGAGESGFTVKIVN